MVHGNHQPTFETFLTICFHLKISGSHGESSTTHLRAESTGKRMQKLGELTSKQIGYRAVAEKRKQFEVYDKSSGLHAQG